MSKNVSKLVSCTAAFLLLAIVVVWGQEIICTNTSPSFICRSLNSYQDCTVEGVETVLGNLQTCKAGLNNIPMNCSMKCPASCELPDSTCLGIGTTCRSKGYMANPNNCREYYVCSLTGTVYTRYNYTCNGYFDAAVHKCSNDVTVCEDRPLYII